MGCCATRWRRQGAHDGQEETTSDTTVLRDCSDLQKKGILGGTTSFQFRVRGMETTVQRVRALGFVAISVDAPDPIAVNENGQSGAGNPTAIG